MNKRKIVKIITLLIFLFIFGFILYKAFPFFWNLRTESGRDSFALTIKNWGYKGPLAIIVLAICKTVLIFLPSEPIEIVSGMCYGSLLGWIFVYLGYLISTIIIGMFVKKFGVSFVKEFASDKQITKVESAINNNPQKAEITLFFLYFLPAIPKDILTYVGCLLPISIKRFVIISMIARIPATLSSTFVGANLLQGNWLLIILTYLTTYAISGILILIYNIITKTNTKKS